MNILKCFALAAVVLSTTVSCNKYLDVVPDDGVARIDMAFNLRSSAIRYLGTCYSYMHFSVRTPKMKIITIIRQGSFYIEGSCVIHYAKGISINYSKRFSSCCQSFII